MSETHEINDKLISKELNAQILEVQNAVFALSTRATVFYDRRTGDFGFSINGNPLESILSNYHNLSAEKVSILAKLSPESIKEAVIREKIKCCQEEIRDFERQLKELE